MKQPLVSVVVPVYNVEDFLAECLNSVRAQTYENIEIIVVDDESPDNSMAIAEELQIVDNRIKIYRKKNGGIASARNYGAKQANGEYITFLDSDDMFSPKMIEKLLTACLENDAKVSISKFSKDIKQLGNDEKPDNQAIDGGFVAMLKALATPGFPTVSADMKLYHHSLLENVEFPQGMEYEDVASYLFFLDQVEKIVLCNHVGYYYRTNENSMTKTKITNKKFDIIKANEMQISLVKNKHPEALEYIYRMCMNNNDFVAMNCVLDGSKLAMDLYAQLLKLNRSYSKNMPFRKQLYASSNVYKLTLKAMSNVYYNDSVRNFMKRVLS